MKLNKNTVEVLKNFSTINAGIIFKEGNVVRSMSVMRNVFARAVVPDTFAKEFAVYDLPEFISTMSLFEDPSITFEDNHLVLSEGTNRIKYFYSSPTVIIAPPDKELKMSTFDASFNLKATQFEQLSRAANVMRLKEFSITKTGISALNVESEGNNYTVDLPVTTDIDNLNVVIPVDLLKLFPGDYTVKILSGVKAQFVCTSAGFELEYFIALAATA